MNTLQKITSALRPAVPAGLVPRLAVRAGLAMAIAIAAGVTPASAVTITVETTDAATEGFSATAARAAVGGNPGTTLGAQRRFVFEYAAGVWAERLEGSVPIVISASFDALGGSMSSATLGYAAPTTIHKDVAGAPLPATWYVASLANQFYEDDINDLALGSCPEDLVGGHCPEIISQFNSDVDNQTVFGPVDFYYGIDGNNGSDFDFLTVALHEIAHGLGLLDQVDGFTGAEKLGLDDAYLARLEDKTISPHELTEMTNAQRITAVRHDTHLVWTGPSVLALAENRLSSGVRGDGTPQMYAPSTYVAGLSVDHLDTEIAPDELMEPILDTTVKRDLTITLAMLEDIGWTVEDLPTCGDANTDGKISAGDALLALKTAVGSEDCDERACNVNGKGAVTTTDALVLLKRSVGQDVAFYCPLG